MACRGVLSSDSFTDEDDRIQRNGDGDWLTAVSHGANYGVLSAKAERH